MVALTVKNDTVKFAPSQKFTIWVNFTQSPKGRQILRKKHVLLFRS